jgi:OmpA-OmpF porin, OOP family
MKKASLFTSILFLLCTTCIAQLPAIENGGLVLSKPVTFETGTAILKPESDEALVSVKAFLQAKEYVSLLRIEGHVAGEGNESDNQSLTEKRAMAVCKWLIKNGIDCKRLLAVGFGSNKPVADNSSPGGKALNNRIEFKMAELRGRAIGGMPVDGGGKTAGDSCN